MSERIVLFEVDGYTDVAAYTTHRYSTRGYATWPADTPASTVYEGRLLTPLRARREMFYNGGSRGATQTGFGSVDLANALGAPDHDLAATFRTRSFIERAARVLVGYSDAAYSTFTQVYKGTVAELQVSASKISFVLKDRQRDIENPHQQTKFAGNNSLPNGLEGVADLAGKEKPLIYGKVFNISPPLVNTSRLIYQVNSATISTLDAVYDGGVALTAGAAYASQADMETTAPSVGQYRVWINAAGSYFRLGSSPVYQITADVTAHSAANSTTAQILKAMALAAGIAAGDVSAADVSALDAVNMHVQGIYIDDGITTTDAMSLIALGARAYFGFDLLGVLRMGVPTVGTPVMNITSNNAQGWEYATNADTGLSRLSVTVGYAKYWTTQDSGLASSITAAARSDLAQQYRRTTASTTVSPNPYKRDNKLTVDTLLTAKANADTLAAALQLTAPTQLITIKGVSLTPAQAAALQIGCTVNVPWAAPYTATNLRLVYAIDLDFASLTADITVDGFPV